MEWIKSLINLSQKNMALGLHKILTDRVFTWPLAMFLRRDQQQLMLY